MSMFNRLLVLAGSSLKNDRSCLVIQSGCELRQRHKIRVEMKISIPKIWMRADLIAGNQHNIEHDDAGKEA